MRSGLRRAGPPAPTVAVLGALLALVAACAPDRAEPEPAPPPHVILWLVDTLRADHLSAYGYARPTSPRLEELAAGGVLFENAHVNSNWTQPSVASLLSGRAPPLFPADYSSGVPAGLTLLPEWLRLHGWRTAGFTVTAATAAWFGFDKGFGEYVELDAELAQQVRTGRAGPAFDADRLVAAALDWIDARPPDAPPFFLSLHSVDPHAPYEPHTDTPAFTDPDYAGSFDGSVRGLDEALHAGGRPSEADVRHLVDLYDGEIRFNDAWLGALMDALRARGLFEDTLIVVVSDHGEEFWDRRTHGHGHRNLHTELTHVPLVLSWPRGLPAGLRVPGLMRGIDLAPTLVDALGLPPLPGAEGESVLSRVRRSGSLAGRGALLFADRAKRPDDLLAVRSDDTLLHADPERGATLHDLRRDPQARRDRAPQEPERAARLQARLDAWRAERDARRAALDADRPTLELDPELAADLRAMGYLGGDDG